MCMRQPVGAFMSKQDRSGSTVHHHLIGGAESNGLYVARDDAPSNPLASPALRDRVYRLLCNGQLSAVHKQYVTARKLPAQQVALYTTMPYSQESRSELAQEIAKQVEPRGVPGFWLDPSGVWQLEGPSGMILPVKNDRGQIISCQVNTEAAISAFLLYTMHGNPIPDDKKPWTKYGWLSSAPKDEEKQGRVVWKRSTGVGADAKPHFASFQQRDPLGLGVPPETWIVEGTMKADTVAALTTLEVIGQPGVSVGGQMVAKAVMPCRRVCIAYDMDWQTKQPVDVALAGLISHIAAVRPLQGVDVLTWPSEFKGIDDLLIANEASDAVDYLGRIPAEQWREEFLQRQERRETLSVMDWD